MAVIVVFVGTGRLRAIAEGHAAHRIPAIAKKAIFLTFPDLHAELISHLLSAAPETAFHTLRRNPGGRTGIVKEEFWNLRAR
jgi:hypothetical protein